MNAQYSRASSTSALASVVGTVRVFFLRVRPGMVWLLVYRTLELRLHRSRLLPGFAFLASPNSS